MNLEEKIVRQNNKQKECGVMEVNECISGDRKATEKREEKGD